MPDATDFLRTNQIGQQEDLEFTNADTLEIYLNGLALRRNEVPNVHSSDYFKSDTDKVTIYKVTGSYGYNLKDEDRLKIRFNQGL